MSKENKNKYVISLICLVILVICIVYYNNVKPKVESSDALIQKYYEIKESGSLIYDMKDFINENGNKLSDEHKKDVLNNYLYMLEEKVIALNNLTDYLSYDIYYYKDMDLSVDYETIDDETIKSLFKEAENLDVSVMKVDTFYVFYVDVIKVLDGIEMEINKESKDLFLFLNDIPHTKIYGKSVDEANKLILEKISEGYKLIDTYPNSEDLDAIEMNIKRNLFALFGENRLDCFEDIDKKLYSEEYIASMEGLIATINIDELKICCEEAMKIIKENNNSCTEEVTERITSL